ncbi:MAG: hypothetical protein U0132_22655 [Gemmatimonadaceae bacterium]
MPSDDRIQLALRALERPIAEFRAALAGALAQANSFLAAQRTDPSTRADIASRELGSFANGRLDAAKFSALFASAGTLAPEHVAQVERAVKVLDEVLAQGEDLFQVDVPSGTVLSTAVGEALARIGRAFGAMLLVELVRGDRYQAAEHDGLLDRLDFRAWTRDERRFAPPLVVGVDGADLHVGGLADFTDGRQKIVLVVRGDGAPAALARLITPGTLVLQTTDGAGLDRVATADGPAIAAIVPDTAAQFLHDPRGGKEPWQRFTVWHLPEAPRKALGGASVWQMGEDLRQLAALAAAPSVEPATSGGLVAAGPATVDRLAQWLLGQTEPSAVPDGRA